ncbi:MAG: TusE/DsrC/DsvC family sulfur relay protein [Pseudomonadota bacterium]|nr:MAG: TusE/DsrC/DsvC family sulfur relay protein [Pseudomonadota bacterium]
MHVADKPHALPALDDNGLLIDPAQWNENVAQALAGHFGVGELTDDHWLVINSLREHFERVGAAPAMIRVCRTHGHDGAWVHRLFHTCLNAWRVAGLPDPGEEAKSYLSAT